jgi:hypothetical protein
MHMSFRSASHLLRTAHRQANGQVVDIRAYCQNRRCIVRYFNLSSEHDPACPICGRRNLSLRSVRGGAFEWNGWLPWRPRRRPNCAPMLGAFDAVGGLAVIPI